MLGRAISLKIEFPITVARKADLTVADHGEVLLETKLLVCLLKLNFTVQRSAMLLPWQ